MCLLRRTVPDKGGTSPISDALHSTTPERVPALGVTDAFENHDAPWPRDEDAPLPRDQSLSR